MLFNNYLYLSIRCDQTASNISSTQPSTYTIFFTIVETNSPELCLSTTMSKVWKKFEQHLLDSANWSKFFNKHSPGQRVYPPNTKTQNTEHQVRIDAGETVDGYKNVYLQVNSEAKNTALKKYVSKHGTHSNVAAAKIPVEVPGDKQEEVVKGLVADFREKFYSKIG
jgi:hypothetical protein